ncbi:hypothetical protein JX265_008830 [Neoarthrinium moseri]|uniref:PEBP-like protein n=1 Tax=Neoarthrinium moseri TaxID=1658444 RepID=A0A9P9WHK0_9PEZI|nr:uncharacterized protein JN550_009546 [Neoarthrinium moseri]KAI1848389.1 hypothetical protein JX266_005695 [Neoarthrinium moseri]KAI1863435.1 hypothetical protein JN550_009546 [Neoarthrinium moseri]KAI1863613.1 hypothetical protein JX265_008830 [Neoarthrinium moseri]
MPANSSVDRALVELEKSKVTTLGLVVGKHVGFETGAYIPRADAQSPPELTFDAASPDKTYLAVGLDIDAPFISFNVLGPILHWIQPGFKTSGASSGKLEPTEPFIANYIGPAPPPLAQPHRYIFFLYEQPATFDGKKYAPPDGQPLATTKRMRYSLDDFEKAAGLGEILALNYFKSN